MKHYLLPCLAAFVAGVFVGAGLWIALFLCVAGLVAWWVGSPPFAPDRFVTPIKPIKHFGPRPRDGGH